MTSAWVPPQPNVGDLSQLEAHGEATVTTPRTPQPPPAVEQWAYLLREQGHTVHELRTLRGWAERQGYGADGKFMRAIDAKIATLAEVTP